MKKYYKPEVYKVSLTAKEQILVHCKESNQIPDLGCYNYNPPGGWFPSREHYPIHP